ncbi:unnamed protein product [Cercospora beticola]|nr:unnamed protein product [Cercospora beticola]
MTEPTIQQHASAPTSLNGGVDPSQASINSPASLTGSDLVKHLEWIAYSFVDAINDRDLTWLGDNGPMSPYISQDFVGEQERIPGSSQTGFVGREEHAKFFPMILAWFPNYKIRIFDLSTCVDERKGKAVMFFNGESTGIGDLAMPSTCTVDFQRYDDGHWKMCRFAGVRGMVDGCELVSPDVD